MPPVGGMNDDMDFGDDASFLKVGEEKEIQQGLKKKLLKLDRFSYAVHYTSTLLDGTKFDSSRGRGTPFKFTLGQGQVIKGWDIGIKTMKKGENAVFTVPSALAFGESGLPPTIPAKATLQFDVELLCWSSVKDICKDGGVFKKIVSAGEKWETPKDLDEVLVKYEAKLEDGTVVGKSDGIDFTVKDGYFCPALAKAVKTMKKAEKVFLTVKPQYGFGEKGKAASGGEGAVPPNANLKIELELVSWKTVPEVNDDNKVIKKVLKEGEGYERPNEGAVVKVHYTGTLLDGTNFDSSRDRGTPFKFTLGQGQVIKGWDIGIKTMKKGENAVFTIPPDLAYDGGVFKKIVSAGEKWETPKDLDEVLVKYEAKLEDGTVVEKSDGVEFTVKDGYFCPALAKAVKTMKKAEKMVLARRASGEAAVPPNATLEIELELVSWKTVPEVNDDNKVIKDLDEVLGDYQERKVYLAVYSVFQKYGTSSEPRVKKILVDLRTELGISEDVCSKLENEKKPKNDDTDPKIHFMMTEQIFEVLLDNVKRCRKKDAEQAYVNTLNVMSSKCTPLTKKSEDILLNLSKEWNLETDIHKRFLVRIKEAKSFPQVKKKEPVAVDACSVCKRHDFFSRRDLAKHERSCREIEKKQICQDIFDHVRKPRTPRVKVERAGETERESEDVPSSSQVSPTDDCCIIERNHDPVQDNSIWLQGDPGFPIQET
ncbi:hypothetical protein Bca52824_034450 [Brassica carinata]|uniref:peptidylprolyl isomerase n=1 Tax=Brassica carinata TaxID=52824 RepID=A0A8X7S2G2_BRACI|nr:hypothetical protein Bca52824_034450 [Brassica carinata]